MAGSVLGAAGAGGRVGAEGGLGGSRIRWFGDQKRFVLMPFGFRWKEERTPEKGPGTASVGCQAFSSSAVLGAPLPPPTPAQRGALRGWGAWPGPRGAPAPGLGLRLPPGLPRAAAGREAVLSGVGLQLDSLDSSSSEEERGSDFFPLLPVPLAPLALAARSCLRNLARRFWNHTWRGMEGVGAPLATVPGASGNLWVQVALPGSGVGFTTLPSLGGNVFHISKGIHVSTIM